MSFGPLLELSALDGNNGFVINGVAEYDRSGYSVSNAGDVNGDGFDDLIIGASGADPNGRSSGASYVVFGRSDGFRSSLDLSSLDGSNGFVINGVAEFDDLGYSVSNAGDVNGDGFDDLIIGAPSADPNGSSSGASYVVFGRSDGFRRNLDLSSLDGSNGFLINGIAEFDDLGGSVSSAGDVNGDGFDDLIIGAPYADPNGDYSYSGASYVVFGRSSGFGRSLELSSLDGRNGFVINGKEFDYSGYSVSSAGDVNGDGFDDLIIGASGADPNGRSSGASYVVFGRSDGFSSSLDLSSLDGRNGFVINGVAEFDGSGGSVSSAEDVNGDGFDDLIIGAPGAEPNAYSSGASYVVFGRSDGFSSSLELSSLDGINGFVINGVAAYDFSGGSVSSAGDVNGDGLDDLIIGADGADPNGRNSGASYVVFGQVTTLSSAPTPGDDHLQGTEGDDSIRALSGDDIVNGLGGVDLLYGDDGDDRLFGAAGNDILRGNLGDDQLFGGDGDDLLNGQADNDRLLGGNGDDLLRGSDGDDVLDGQTGNDLLNGGIGDDDLNGSDGDDILRGRAGNDVLNGGFGDDRLNGGAGDDVLRGGSGRRDRLVGGLGSDTFQLETGRGRDRVNDFEVGTDVIDLVNTFIDVEDLTFSARDNNTLILFRNDHIALLVGVDVATVEANVDDIFI